MLLSGVDPGMRDIVWPAFIPTPTVGIPEREWHADGTRMGNDGRTSPERNITVGWQDVGMITDVEEQ